MTGVRTIAIIPARGGSKGIVDKNLVSIGGRPLVHWSIVVALAAGLDRVVVSTDSERIADVARASGAEIPFIRPPELAQDETPDLPVFQHALQALGLDEPSDDDTLVVHLRPTSPARTPELVCSGVRLLVGDPAADSVRSVSPAVHTPYKMWRRADDGRLEPLLGSFEEELFNQPRQALPEVWWHNGVLDVIRANVILRGSMTGRRIRSLVVSDDLAVDIDHASDLPAAAAALQTSGLVQEHIR